MMMDLPALVAKYRMHITGAIHLGARLGEEAEAYVEAKVPKVWWVEANPEVIPDLRAKVEPLGHAVIEALLAATEGEELVYHRTNVRGLSSSVLEFGTHRSFSPDMVYEDHLPMRSRSVDSLVAEHGITGVNYLEADLQGYELAALAGATALIPSLDYIALEVNKADVYVGCAKVWEVDRFLSDFERVETLWIGDQNWGDALLIRKTLL